MFFQDIPRDLSKKVHSGMIPIPDMLFKSDMSSYKGTYFSNICMSIKFREVTDIGNNNLVYIIVYYKLNLVLYPFGYEMCVHPKSKKWDYCVCSKYVVQKRQHLKLSYIKRNNKVFSFIVAVTLLGISARSKCVPYLLMVGLLLSVIAISLLAGNVTLFNTMP